MTKSTKTQETAKKASKQTPTKKPQAATTSKVSQANKVDKAKTSSVKVAKDIGKADSAKTLTAVNNLTTATSLQSPTRRYEGQMAVSETAVEKRSKISAVIIFIIIFAAIASIALIVINTINSEYSRGLDSATATVEGQEQLRYGTTATYGYKMTDRRYADNKKLIVTWFVDDTQVGQGGLNETFSYTPNEVGNHVISARVVGRNNLTVEYNIEVLKPLLKVTLNDIDVVYGTEKVERQYTIEGYVDGDTTEAAEVKVEFDNKYNALTDVGAYDITGKVTTANDKYDVEVVGGKVNVKPRALKVKFDATTKQYDGADTVVGNIILEGSINNDQVRVEGVNIKSAAKNVGLHKLLFNDVKLTGDKSGNYVLEPTEMYIKITPKKLKVDNIKANSKMYDGTDKVTFSNIGELQGVVNGDIVGIGEISARFDNAKAGASKQVLLTRMQLVGRDASNYCLDDGIDVRADITHNSLWDSIFNNNVAANDR